LLGYGYGHSSQVMLPGLMSPGVGTGGSMLPSCAASWAPESISSRVRMNELNRLYMAFESSTTVDFGDIFAYALARISGEPLLFKGDDFAKTDIGRVT
jgi:hypothetical protein